MSNEKPYGDTYYAEMSRLQEAQDRVSQSYTAQMMYLRLGGSYDRDTSRARRKQVAEEAAQEWIRLNTEIQALQAAEYRKKQSAEKAQAVDDPDECDGPCCRYPAVLP